MATASSKPAERISWPRWDQLRLIGGLSAMKASYLTILVVPLAAESNSLTDALGLAAGLRMQLSYFAAISLLLAKLVYDTRCPPTVHRYDSALTMHESLLEMEERSTQLGHNETVDSQLAACEAKYAEAAISSVASRRLCSILFFVAGLLSIAILIERTITVFKG